MRAPPLGLLCDAAAARCVRCLAPADCNADEQCTGGTCVPNASGTGGTGGVSGSGGTGDAGQAGDASGAGGTADAGGAGGTSSSGGAPNDGGGGCAVSNVLYLVLDQSASMLDSTNKWQLAVDGITTFVGSPASAGLAVGLALFPTTITGTVGCGLCDGTDCAVPAIDATVLPDVPGTITALLSGTTPIGIGTPLEAAVRGGTQFCQTFEASHPGRSCGAVFITDGLPTTCEMTSDGLAAIAGAALSAGVPTFVVGMTGADFTILDAIAQAGGTDCDPGAPESACRATSSPAVASALDLARDALGKCAGP